MSATVTVFQKGKGRLGRQTLSLNNSSQREEKPRKQELRVVHQSISDDDAIKRANMLTPEDQNMHMANSRKKLRVLHNNSNNTLEGRNTYQAREPYFGKPAVKEKESRVPGLYGCNRWKTNQPNKEADSQTSYTFF